MESQVINFGCSKEAVFGARRNCGNNLFHGHDARGGRGGSLFWLRDSKRVGDVKTLMCHYFKKLGPTKFLCWESHGMPLIFVLMNHMASVYGRHDLNL